MNEHIYVANFNIRRWTISVGHDYLNGSLNDTDRMLGQILNREEEFDSYVLHPWAWVEAGLTIPYYVYIVPTLAFLTFCLNTLVIVVFVRENMLSPTNILMIAIAISDTLNVILPSPFLVYLYFSGDAPFIPNHLCRIWDYFSKYLPEIAHTSSIWITLLLSVYRFIGVCRPFQIRIVISKRGSLYFIALIYCCASALHFSRFVDTKYVDVYVVGVKQQVFTCKAVHADWLKGANVVYECIYYWTVIVFVKIVPLTSLITLDFIMANELIKAEKRRRKFYPIVQQLHESTRVTWIVITVAAILSVVEIPITVVLILWTLSMVHDKYIVPEDKLGEASVILNLIIYISFPCVLFLYCLMSKKFQKSLPCRPSNCSKQECVELDLMPQQ